MSTEALARGAGTGDGERITYLSEVESPDRARSKAAQRIEPSLRYMMQHLHQPMKVPTLSAMAGLSNSSFFALFKSATGQTPLDFLIRARMQRAGELLAGTSLQIKEVAALLGYDDQFYFSRLFKSVHGLPPREYRVQKTGSNEQNRNRKLDREKSPAVYLPRLVPAGENQKSARVLIGGFQPAALRANTFPESACESSAKPNQKFSIPQ
ncbi:MAG: AraC family transcriptional regulator [Verrucomicrobiota bacterium]